MGHLTNIRRTAAGAAIALYCVVATAAAPTPPDLTGVWTNAAPAGGGISAVGYYFARRIQQSLPDLPIGLVQDCVGGSPAESWMSAEALRALGLFGAPLDEIARLRRSGALE